MSIQYYHPTLNKTITIEEGFNGGVTTVTETNGGQHTQSLTMRESEMAHFVEGLVSNGWLKRQQL